MWYGCLRTLSVDSVDSRVDLASPVGQMRQLEGDIAIAFNGMGWADPDWNPSTSPASLCNSFSSIFNHEVGHIVRDVGNSGHQNDSVLMSVGVNSGLTDRHLWNVDISNIAYGAEQPGHVEVHLHTGIGGTTQTLLGSAEALHEPAFSHGPGGNCPSEGYMTAFPITVPYFGIRVRYGDGYVWSRIVDLPYSASAPFYTQRRPCIATDNSSGNDVYLLWAEVSEEPWTGGANSGARRVFVSESHDRGVTFGTPYALPWAYTREGVSCAYDRSQSRIVVAYQGSGEEGLWTAHRLSNAVGVGAWTTFQRIQGGTHVAAVPTSPDGPALAFDVFGNTSHGFIAWYEGQSNQLLSAPITYNGTAYELSGPAVVMPPGPVWYGFESGNAATLLRGTPAIRFEGAADLGLSMDYGGFSEIQRQLRLLGLSTAGSSPFGGPHESYNNSPTDPRPRYAGAASNRCYAEQSYAVFSNRFRRLGGRTQ